MYNQHYVALARFYVYSSHVMIKKVHFFRFGSKYFRFICHQQYKHTHGVPAKMIKFLGEIEYSLEMIEL